MSSPRTLYCQLACFVSSGVFADDFLLCRLRIKDKEIACLPAIAINCLFKAKPGQFLIYYIVENNLGESQLRAFENAIYKKSMELKCTMYVHRLPYTTTLSDELVSHRAVCMSQKSRLLALPTNPDAIRS